MRYVVTFATGGDDAGTVAGQLHRLDGSARSDRPHLGRFRLRTEGPKGGLPIGALLGPNPQTRGVPYKLFELVEGALLEIPAEPGEEVRATLGARTPTGRTLRFVARTRADASGVARLRVPYTTSRDGPTPALGPYRVTSAGRVLPVEVGESDVREGRVIRLGGPS